MTTPTDTIIAALRQALRPIDDEGQQHGGPDGWSPTPEEISEWEESFREAANPLAIRTLLDAHANALRDAERYRKLRMMDWFDGPLCVVNNPKRLFAQPLELGTDCPSRDRLDAAIDAVRSALDDNTKGAAE